MLTRFSNKETRHGRGSVYELDRQTKCHRTGSVTELTERATGPVLTSDEEEKPVILPTTLNFVVRREKLRSYTYQNPPEVF